MQILLEMVLNLNDKSKKDLLDIIREKQMRNSQLLIYGRIYFIKNIDLRDNHLPNGTILKREKRIRQSS